LEISDPQQRFDGQTVLVIGIGKSGIASTAVLKARGATVVATDEAQPSRLQDAIAEIEARGARFLAPHDLDSVLRSVAFAVLSPGVPPKSKVAQRVREAGIAAIGEVELAYRLCGAPMIAITGTKGKSTTAALIAHLLRASGKDARLGGNIGEPLVNAAVGAPSSAWIVAELSSFQLETIVRMRPRVSVLLNIAPDHLDRYASIEEYAEAKFRIFSNQGAGDAIVLDRDDPRLAALEERFRSGGCEAQRLWYTLDCAVPGVAMATDGDDIVYVPDAGAPVRVVTRADVPLTGEHNLRNAMAALLAALRVGCDPLRLRDGMRSFRALAHRLQRVAEIDGVLYVDDSKATNPMAAAAAVRAFERPVVLIAGGREKGTEFDALASAIRERAKSVIGIGEAAPILARISGDVPFSRAASMEEAVERARGLARAGDVVLLAPACASYDMFANAEDRGERFVAAVESLEEGARA
jgi:UDP-N-acetylmuramoylalanine--D-glutamate ligase